LEKKIKLGEKDKIWIRDKTWRKR